MPADSPLSGGTSSAGGSSAGQGGFGGGTATCDPPIEVLGPDGKCHPRAFDLTLDFWIYGAVIDAADAVVVRGWPVRSGGFGSPGFLAKVGPAGDLAWQKDLERGALDLAIDADDNLYLSSAEVLGLGGAAGDPIGSIEKRLPDGELAWREAIGPIEEDLDVLVAVSDDGKLYAAGTTIADLFGPSTGEADVFVARYDLDGHRRWGVRLGGSDSDGLEDMVVSSDGTVMIATWTTTYDYYEEYYDTECAVRGLSPVDGSELWAVYPACGSRLQLAVDSSDNLLVSASPWGYSSSAVLTKYDAAHEMTWSYEGIVGQRQAKDEVVSGASGVITWAVRGTEPISLEEFAFRLTPDGQELPLLFHSYDRSVETLATRGDALVVGGRLDWPEGGWLRKYLDP